MNKTYEPIEFESRLYREWEANGYFHADRDKDKEPYTIVIPPPNITGQLHMGHALNNTLQDAITRRKRMQGYSALWVPGTDHASIATEVKIIEKLRAEGVSKEGIGRDAFLQRAWEWYDQYGGRIVTQLKRLGSSCDWDRLAFTMDENCSKAVRHVFVKLYEKGLIYRGNRIINWCPVCKTALSDAEVDHKELHSHIWHIKYPIEDGSGFITVATTRPETMLGDTAVAVNPGDKRYKGLVGKNAVLPLLNRVIPIIADEYVQPGFGSGAVKITPAHDPNDYEVAKRHNIPEILVLNEDGTVNDNGGKYCGQDRFIARKNIINDLKLLNLLEKIENYSHEVGHCYRCSNIVEPMTSLQWFVKMDGLAKPAINALTNKELKFTPARFGKIYLHWLNNIRDWCISRQLWWGHRIPAYICADCGSITVSETEVTSCKCGGSVSQDEAVLDTWFSSALWPFSTLGFPDKTPDLAYFFPTNTLVTAQDIIFFWVVRMVFSSLEFMKELPFKDVVINGLVRDKQGRKMSKSLGNGIDPLELIDKFGADALRFSLLFGNATGRDFRFSEEKVESDRTFINKLWNAARFVILNCDRAPGAVDVKKLNKIDKFILHKWNETVKRVNRMMDKFEIGMAATAAYEFVWNDFCDWYIEFSKTMLYSGVNAKKEHSVSLLVFLLTDILKLLHPILPFVTEEIYKNIPGAEGTIMLKPYPEYNPKFRFLKEYKDITAVIEAIKGVRALRLSMKIPLSKKTKLFIMPFGSVSALTDSLSLIEKQAGGQNAEIVNVKPSIKCVSAVTPLCEMFIPLDELIDKEKELRRLNAELEIAKSEFDRAEGKMKNERFMSSAPAALVQTEREKAAKYSDLVNKLVQNIKDLGNQ